MIAIHPTEVYDQGVEFSTMPFKSPIAIKISAVAALVFGVVARGDETLPIAVDWELELSCASQPGHTYQIQVSDNLIDWDFLSPGREFGGDGYQDTHVPMVGEGKFFRYIIAAQPPGGLAPWSVTLRKWVLNVQGRAQVFHFDTPDAGNICDFKPGSTPVPFTYAVQRTGEDVLRLKLNLPESVQRTIDVHYLSPSQGEFTSTDVVAGITVETEAGVFAESNPAASEPLAPLLLEQKAAVLKGTASVDYYNFDAMPSSTTIGSPHVNPSTSYTYNRTDSSKAELTLQTGNRIETYQLTFVTGQSGTYTLVRTHPTAPEFHDTGVFVLATAP